MESNRKVALGVGTILVTVLIASAVGGLNLAFQKHPDLRWLYLGGALLAFVLGFAVMETALNYIRQDFQIEIEKERERAGRSLSLAETERLKTKFKEKRRQGSSNIRFPLQRVVVRFILLLPVVVTTSILIAGGSFLAGFILAGLVGECRKQTINHL